MLLGAALLLTGCSLLSPKDKEADAMGIDTSGPPAFTLEVDAPKQVRALLEQHLELKRFRHQPDLQRRELTRLLGATDANVRELIGTLGYFSPTVTVELTDTPEEEAPRKVVVKVDPGPPTIIEKSEVRFTGVNACALAACAAAGDASCARAAPGADRTPRTAMVAASKDWRKTCFCMK